MKYRIWIEYHYYVGTFNNVPSDDWMRDHHNKPIELPTRGEAEQLAKHFESTARTACWHGEYARPTYGIWGSHT